MVCQGRKGGKDHYLQLSPFVIDDRIIIADYSGQVSAFNASTGEQFWKLKLDLAITSAGGGDGLIILGTENGLVEALNGEEGSKVWQTDLSSEILSTPSVDDGVVVIRSVDGLVYGLDASNGSRLWVYQYSIPTLTLRGTADPTIADDKVIVGLPGGKLVALSLKDGQLLWERTIVAPRGRTELDRLVDIDSKPIVDGGYIYTVTYNGRIAAVWLADGDIFWTREMSSYAGLNVEGNTIYVTDTEDYVWALESRTGASLWRQSKLLRRRLTAPIPYQNYIVVGDLAGYLHWLAKDDGRFVARLQIGKAGIINTPLVVNDVLYANSEEGVLKAIKIASGSKVDS